MEYNVVYPEDPRELLVPAGLCGRRYDRSDIISDFQPEELAGDASIARLKGPTLHNAPKIISWELVRLTKARPVEGA